MKKKLIGRIGALLMAATMAFSSGTPAFADETQSSQEYEDEDHSVIEEGTGYEIEKGTPLDGGGYTTWVRMSVSKLDGNDVNDTIEKIMESDNVVTGSSLSVYEKWHDTTMYYISKKNLEAMKEKEMLFETYLYTSVDDQYICQSYRFNKVENVSGDFHPTLSINSDSNVADKIKKVGLDKFYTLTTSGTPGTKLIGEGELYAGFDTNIGNFEFVNNGYGYMYADNINVYYYNPNSDKFVKYTFNSDKRKADSFVYCSEDYHSFYIWHNFKLNGTYVALQGELPNSMLENPSTDDETKKDDTPKTDDSTDETKPSDTKTNGDTSETKPSDTKTDDGESTTKPSSTTATKTAYADGLNQINGEWVYYKNNKIDTSYTGLCKYNGSWWYVKNGKVDFSATTLCKYNGSWFYVSGGKVNFNYTGLCKYNGTWFYVKGGQVSFTTTLCKYNGTWWYVKNGHVDFKSTGLCKYNGSWWYVTGGKVNFTTTLCKYNGTWWYIKNGKVDFSSTTLCKYGNAWYCVSGGKVAWNYTGLCKYNGSWFYVKNGVVNFRATTLTKYAGTWWYVKNGVLNTSTTLCKYGNNWFAVSGGKVAWNYSGTIKYYGTTYNVVKGVVKF